MCTRVCVCMCKRTCASSARELRIFGSASHALVNAPPLIANMTLVVGFSIHRQSMALALLALLAHGAAPDDALPCAASAAGAAGAAGLRRARGNALPLRRPGVAEPRGQPRAHGLLPRLLRALHSRSRLRVGAARVPRAQGSCYSDNIRAVVLLQGRARWTDSPGCGWTCRGGRGRECKG